MMSEDTGANDLNTDLAPHSGEAETHAVPLEAGIYLVSTPIGNLKDITLRALETLKFVDLIAAEDTRVTQKLLSRYGLKTPLTSYHAHTDASKEDALIDKVAGGVRLAVVSDAGTPLLSDPGESLLKKARTRGIPVHCIPGVSAPLVALTCAPFPAYPFYFGGFLPPKQKKRRDVLSGLGTLEATLVFFESPNRIEKTVQDLDFLFPQRDICLARELTKLFEEAISGNPKDVLSHLRDKPPRGEYVLLIAPPVKTEAPFLSLLQDALQIQSLKDAVKSVSTATGVARAEVYQAALRIKKEEIPSQDEDPSQTL